MTKTIRTAIAVLVAVSGCAYFNTYFNANKAYENGLKSLERSRQVAQRNIRDSYSDNLFSTEFDNVPGDALASFTRAIEKANQVVVLYPDSRWVEKAIFLMGRAHYLRATLYLENGSLDKRLLQCQEPF